MQKKRRILIIYSSLLRVFLPVIMFLIASNGFADQRLALKAIKDSNNRILKIYLQHQTIDDAARKQIFNVMDRVTDYQEIATRTVDQFCLPTPPETCRRLKKVFKDLLRLSAVQKLGRYRADRFEYLGQRQDGERVIVNTIAYYRDEAINLDYILLFRGGRWMIINYIVDDIDTTRNYRRQFARILKTESIESLIKRLEVRVDKFSETY